MEITPQEANRLDALYGYGVLDTGFEERFDRITRIASRILDTPISLITLVDKDRQWFKSSVGLDLRETPRNISFCAHAIQGTEVFVVPDASKDNLFSSNPLVTGKPDIRFYAGAPLIGHKGQAIGTLCIIDRKPREGFNAEAQQVLRDLADTVIDMLEMRLALGRAQALKRKLITTAAQLAELAK